MKILTAFAALLMVLATPARAQNPSTTAVRIIRGFGAPVSAQCATNADVSKVYVRLDSASSSSPLYICTNTGTGTYGWQLSSTASIVTGAFYQTVQDEGSALTQRGILNFIGAGVACVDGTTKTNCTIPGASSLAFSAITSATNTTAAMVLGTGASLDYTGGGTNHASSVGTASATQVCVGATCAGFPTFKYNTVPTTPELTVGQRSGFAWSNEDYFLGNAFNSVALQNPTLTADMMSNGDIFGTVLAIEASVGSGNILYGAEIDSITTGDGELAYGLEINARHLSGTGGALRGFNIISGITAGSVSNIYGGTITATVDGGTATTVTGLNIGASGGSSNYAIDVTAGTVRLADPLIFTADNTKDIGASAATRPRTGYFGTSVIAPTGTFATAANAAAYQTATNCADSAGAAACGSAAAGAFVTDAAGTSTVVSTSAVTANSQIFVFFDAGLSTRLSVTCNSTVPSLYGVTARTAGTSFTLTTSAPIANPACWNYLIVN